MLQCQAYHHWIITINHYTCYCITLFLHMWIIFCYCFQYENCASIHCSLAQKSWLCNLTKDARSCQYTTRYSGLSSSIGVLTLAWMRQMMISPLDISTFALWFSGSHFLPAIPSMKQVTSKTKEQMTLTHNMCWISTRHCCIIHVAGWLHGCRRAYSASNCDFLTTSHTRVTYMNLKTWHQLQINMS